MGLNSRGKGQWLTKFKLFVRGMQGFTKRNSLNSISCIMLTLSSCVWKGSDNISKEVIGVCSSPWIIVNISGCGYRVVSNR